MGKKSINNRIKTLVAATVAAAMWTTASASFEADSLYIFSYAEQGGKSGLRLAVSTDGEKWEPIGENVDFVKSDFGSWGGAPTSKKMYFPRLYFSNADRQWHCLWQVTPSGATYAVARSSNLVDWRPQKFFRETELVRYMPSDVRHTDATEARVDGKTQYGLVQKIPAAEVGLIRQRVAENQRKASLNNEQAKDDPTRFASLRPVKATVNVTGDSKPISDKLIGIFFEDINYAADGGLYAELVRNRDFEFNSKDRNGWNALTGWSVNSDISRIDTVAPLHPNNRHYLAVHTASAPETVTNGGFDGIALKKGDRYDLSLSGRITGDNGRRLKVSLLDRSGKAVATAPVNVTPGDWHKMTARLTPTETVDSAVLAIEIPADTRIDLDMISLFPAKTFKNRPNGLRADLAGTLADLKPRFVRFPGGCVAHGQGIDNIYDWKGSVGPLEARKPLMNLWGYHQTRGLGYDEYFRFCEDIGAEPLPVLAAGVPCQNSNRHAHHTHDELTRYGQQDGIPMEEMDSYIQDILDLIEYANGDARTTRWGAERAANGHTRPYNLKYIGIGNEDLISEAFEVRFKMINDAIKAKYPDITVVGTVGPFYEGADYDEGWDFARKENVAMVDEHYYVSPGWMINNQDYYDNYDRRGPKVYLGEYAAHLPGRPSNIETAMAEALYLTSVERNADVVAMTSYAPLLAKDNHTQWRPDLIYFNNTEVRPTVDYYVQQLYGQNSGYRYVTSEIALDNDDEAVAKRIGVSVVTDSKSGDMIVKLVNMLPVEVETTVNLPRKAGTATKTVLSGKPADNKVEPVSSKIKIGGSTMPVNLPPYSMTVVRVK